MRHVKNLLLVFILLWSHWTVYGQTNVNLEGRWAEGRSEAVFRRGGITFAGNGARLELFRTVNGEYNQLAEFIVLPGVIQDLWVTRDTSYVYAACGEAGVRVVAFNSSTLTFGEETGFQTGGFASGIAVQGDNLYIADGYGGILTYGINSRLSPVYKATIVPPGFVHEVWAVNSQIILAAAGSEGVYSVNVATITSPFLADSIKTFSNSLFSAQAVSRHIISNDTVAYAANGPAGMSMIDIRDPYDLQELGNWQIPGDPVDVREVWVNNTSATLACGDDGIYSPVNISDPENPAGPGYEALNTDGFASAVVTEGDQAFVCDGYNGHLLLTIQSGSSPRQIKRFASADQVTGVEISGNYVYAAAARAGLKIFSLSGIDPDTKEMQIVSQVATDGEILALSKRYSRLYAANGSAGLMEIDVSNHNNPFINQTFATADTCYNVHAPQGNYIYLACGTDGLRVLDASKNPLSELAAYRIQTAGSSSRAVQAIGSRLYLANTNQVSVYDISAIPGGAPSLVSSLNHPDIDARNLHVQGDSVYVANGRYGFLIWNLADDTVDAVSIDGTCTDVHIRNRTLFVTDSNYGLRIFDLSSPGEYVESGDYPTWDKALSLVVNGDYIGLADRNDGLYLLKSEIKPVLSFDPNDLLDFGPVPFGKSRPRLIWVENTGTELLSGSFSVPASYADEFIFDKDHFSISPGEKETFEVLFQPAEQYPLAPPFSITMNLLSNDPDPAKDSTLTLQWQGGTILSEINQYRADAFTVGLWHFDETGGNVAYDASGYAVKLNGSLQDDAYFLTSSKTAFKNAVRFDGVEDRVLVPSDDRLDLGNAPFTYELWFRMNEKPQEYAILMQRGINTAIQFQLALGGESAPADRQGVMAFLNGVTADYTLNTGAWADFVTGHWYHIALTSDREYLRLFLNGVLKDSTAQTGAIVNASGEQLGIGSSAYGNAPFKGEIDEVRISNIARQNWEFNINRSRLEISERALNFSSVLKGQKRSLPLVFTSKGSETLHITDVALQNGSGSVSTDFSSDIEISPGDTEVITVTFAPEVQMTLDDVLLISSSDPTYPVITVPLSGLGKNSFPAGEYQTDVFTLGLYHYNATGGSALTDASGNAMHGFWNEESWTSHGRFSQALYFSGTHNTTAYIKPGSTHSLAPRWGGYTVEGWFNLETLPLQPSVMLGRGDDSWSQFEVWLQGGVLYGSYFSDDQQQNQVTVNSSGMSNLKINEWYHFALVHSADSVFLYLNGSAAGSAAFSGRLAGYARSVQNDTSSVRIGSDWDRNKRFKGRIDEMRISSTARLPWEFNVDMARVSFNRDTLDFDSVLLNKTRFLKLTVRNNGLDNLVVTNVQTSNTVFTAGAGQFSVGPGMEHDIEIGYTPLAAETHKATLQMVTNDPFNKYVTINLSGTGTDKPVSGAYRADLFAELLYHFEHSQGDTVLDHSDNALTGRITGNGQWAPNEGVFGGNALYLNGADTWVTVPGAGGSIDFSGDFTIEFWFNLAELPPNDYPLFYLGGPTGPEIDLRVNSQGTVTADFQDNSGSSVQLSAQPPGGLDISRWNHLNVYRQGDSLGISVNKSRPETSFFDGGISFPAEQILYLGGKTGEASFFGLLDELRISSIYRQDWELHVREKEISVSPAELDFATVLTTQRRTLQLGVGNLGDQNLSIVSITGGGDSFSIPDSLTSFVLGRRSVTVVPVTYQPLHAQTTDRDSLVIVAEDTTVTVQLSGSGTDEIKMREYTSDAHTLLLYHCNQSDGGMLTDASSYGLEGTLENGLLLGPGLYNTSGLQFDGVDDYVRTGHNGTLSVDFSSQSFTVECYFRTDTVSQGLVYLGSPDSVNFGLYINRYGQIAAEGFGAGGPAAADDSWHHAALMYDHLNKQGRLYLDGNTVWRGSWSGSAADHSGDDLIIGAKSGQHGFFSGYMDEIRISSIPRESWEFQFIPYGIHVKEGVEFVHKQPTTLEVIIPLELGAQENSVHVFYRPGGSARYQSALAQVSADTVYSVILTSDAVRDIRGIEYYIEMVTANGDTVTYPQLDPYNNPMTAVVTHGGVKAGVNVLYKKYMMISVPFALTDASIDSVLKDFGTYDPYKWELFWWDPVGSEERWSMNADTVYYHVTEDSGRFEFTPGRSCWFATGKAIDFRVGGGTTVTTDSSFQLKLAPGWNMIANPFNFNVAWSSCFTTDSTTGLYHYDYTLSDGPILDWPVMEPWKGYWVYNLVEDTVMLSILPRETYLKPPLQTQKISPLRGAAQSSGSIDVRLAAVHGQSRDMFNYAGIRPGAAAAWDYHDRPEPPAMDRNINLSFNRTDWEHHPGRYAADYRPAGTEGEIWDFDVTVPAKNGQVTVSWDVESQLPDAWRACLFVLEDGYGLDMSTRTSLTFSNDNPEGVYAFRLVMGSPDFIEEHSDNMSTSPVDFQLQRNYPNPFNPETTITYSIPEKTGVELIVYNSIGQKVCTLVDKTMKAGHYQAVWDGKDINGRSVASGVYICRLKTASRTAVQKMVLIR